ncbi:MAG: hypothetical protein ACH34X_15965 [Thiolinea sp.]
MVLTKDYRDIISSRMVVPPDYAAAVLTVMQAHLGGGEWEGIAE